MGTNTLGFTSAATTGTSHFTVDGTKLNVNAVANRVGIGTANPSGPLHISGNAATSWPNSSMYFTNTGTGGHTWAFGARPAGTNGDFSISDETDGSQRMVIQGGTGNVGIGTNVPGSKLHVVGNSRFVGTEYIEGSIFLRSPDGTDAGWIRTSEEADIANAITIESSRGAGKIIFKTNNGPEGVAERVRIANNGNVGIGTSTPTTPLQVNGAVRVGTSAQTAAAAGAGAIRYNSTSGQMEYSNGTEWNLIAAPVTGAVLRTVVVPTSSLTVTGDNSATVNISFNYTPISSNSTIIVEADADYGLTAFAGLGQTEVFVSKLLVNNSQRMVKRQIFRAAEYGGSGTRSATMLPISGSVGNTSTTAKNVTINMYRESGDDTIDLYGSYFVKVTEIQN